MQAESWGQETGERSHRALPLTSLHANKVDVPAVVAARRAMPVAGCSARILTNGGHAGSLIRRLLRRWRRLLLLLLLPLLHSQVALVLLFLLLLQLHGQLQVASRIRTWICTGNGSAWCMQLRKRHRH